MSSKLVKQAIRLLLGGAVLSVSLWTMPVKAQQVSDAQVAALVEALRLAAPQTGTENDGLYSDWQIKPENIPRWSKQCIGQELTPRQFEARPIAAREILVCVMRDVFKDQYSASGSNESVAVQRAASWWMTGDASRYSNPPNAYTRSYIQKVAELYQQQLSNARSQPPDTPSQPTAQTQTPDTPSQPTAAQPSEQPAAPKPQARARSSANSPVSDAQVAALVEALRLAAPQTGIEDDGLYSQWQIKPENIPRWSKQCTDRELTPTQFEASPVTARAILVCVMRDVLGEQYNASSNDESVAVQRAASWWMTGDPNQYSSGSTAAYTSRVLDFYKQSQLKFFSHI